MSGFDSSHCEECSDIDCLTKCQWIDFASVDHARKEQMKMINGEESHVLKDCMICFACDEYCPYNSHPFDLKNELQEKYQYQNLAQLYEDKQIKQNLKVEDSEIEEYYKNNQEEFKKKDGEIPPLDKVKSRIWSKIKKVKLQEKKTEHKKMLKEKLKQR